jgi:hypothetical protein
MTLRKPPLRHTLSCTVLKYRVLDNCQNDQCWISRELLTHSNNYQLPTTTTTWKRASSVVKPCLELVVPCLPYLNLVIPSSALAKKEKKKVCIVMHVPRGNPLRKGGLIQDMVSLPFRGSSTKQETSPPPLP